MRVMFKNLKIQNSRNKWSLTSMRPLVDLEVLGAGEDLPAAGEGAGEGLLARVHADVVDQLVLGLEGAAVARAALPEAGVRGALRAAHVLHGEVRHDLVHGGEQLVAHLARRRLLGVEPLAAHVAARRRAHVAQEGVRRGGAQRRRLVGRLAPLPALLQPLLREQLAARAVVAQVAGLVGVQRVGLRVVRRGRRRGARRARLLRRHLEPVGREVRMVGLEECVHGGGRRRRIAPVARHHPRAPAPRRRPQAHQRSPARNTYILHYGAESRL